MRGLLIILFIVVPILEIVVFIQVGKWIGLWPTVAGVVMMAVIGAAIVRHQGLSVLGKVQRSVGEGRFPVAELFDALCLFIAGVLLLTPGFLTDAAALPLLVPPMRAWLRQIVGSRMMASGRVEVWTDGPRSPRPSSPDRSRGGIIIDADYEHVPEEPFRQTIDEPGAWDRANGRTGSPWRKDGPEDDAKSDKRTPKGDENDG